MGTFAETAIIDYRLSFADQGKQTSAFHLQQTSGILPFPFSENKKKLPLSISSIFPLQNFGNVETWTWKWRHQTENGSLGDFY
jgi:hypothetical protein